MRMERNGMERERNVKGKKDNYLGNIKKTTQYEIKLSTSRGTYLLLDLLMIKVIKRVHVNQIDDWTHDHVPILKVHKEVQMTFKL